MYDTQARHERLAARAAARAPVVHHESGTLPRATRAVRVPGAGVGIGSGAGVSWCPDAESVVMLPSGTLGAISGGFGEGIRVHDVAPPVSRHHLHSGAVSAGCVSVVCDDVLVTANEMGGVMTWRASSGEYMDCHALLGRKPTCVTAGNGRVIVADENACFSLLHTTDGSHISRVPASDSRGTGTAEYSGIDRGFRGSFGVAFAMVSFEDLIAASSPLGIGVWDLSSRRCLARLPLEARGPYRLALSASYLVAANFEEIRVYSHEENFPLRMRITGAYDVVANGPPALFMLSDDTILTGGVDGTLTLVCLHTGSVLDRTRTPLKNVYDVGVTVHGRLLVVSPTNSGNIAVFELLPGTRLSHSVHKYARLKYGKKYISPRNIDRGRGSSLIALVAASVVSVAAFLVTRPCQDSNHIDREETI